MTLHSLVEGGSAEALIPFYRTVQCHVPRRQQSALKNCSFSEAQVLNSKKVIIAEDRGLRGMYRKSSR